MTDLRFLDDYEDAVKYAKIQRRQTPPLYNPARAREQPIPIITQPGISSPLVGTNNNDRQASTLNFDDDSEPDDDFQGNAPILVEVQVHGQSNNNGNASDTSNQDRSSTSTSLNNVDENSSLISSAEEVVDPLAVNDDLQSSSPVLVEVQADDQSYYNGNTSFEKNQDPLNNVDENGLLISSAEENVDPLGMKTEAINNHSIDADEELDNLATVQIEVLEDDIVVTYDDKKLFKPIQSQLQMKRNDSFSGSQPFEEDVSIFFRFVL